MPMGFCVLLLWVLCIKGVIRPPRSAGVLAVLCEGLSGSMDGWCLVCMGRVGLGFWVYVHVYGMGGMCRDGRVVWCVLGVEVR